MKHIITMTVLLCLQVAAFAQITPSVYVGVGTGTNLGGTGGVGTEIRYKMVSVNAAVGTAWIKENGHHLDSQSPLGWDVGLKVYPIKGWFLGVNYGVISEGSYKDISSGESVFSKQWGFSFTTGYHWCFYKGLYGMGFIGLTDKIGINSFFPRFGLLIGWDFLKKKTK
ncbi:MAG: hypothetical protein II063_09765 [Prevotella sp.]|nr:hypothetical protein [Prevotella sp.]